MLLQGSICVGEFSGIEKYFWGEKGENVLTDIGNG